MDASTVSARSFEAEHQELSDRGIVVGDENLAFYPGGTAVHGDTYKTCLVYSTSFILLFGSAAH